MVQLSISLMVTYIMVNEFLHAIFTKTEAEAICEMDLNIMELIVHVVRRLHVNWYYKYASIRDPKWTYKHNVRVNIGGE